MLGFTAIGQSPIGAIGGPVTTAPAPPATNKARASQFAYVVPAAPNTPPQSSLMAYVVPSADLAIPSVGAQSSQIAFVSVGLEYATKPVTHGYTIRQLWGFPLLIQTGV